MHHRLALFGWHARRVSWKKLRKGGSHEHGPCRKTTHAPPTRSAVERGLANLLPAAHELRRAARRPFDVRRRGVGNHGPVAGTRFRRTVHWPLSGRPNGRTGIGRVPRWYHDHAAAAEAEGH